MQWSEACSAVWGVISSLSKAGYDDAWGGWGHVARVTEHSPAMASFPVS